MIPVQGYQGRKVAVLGLGRSGLATARALLAGGAEALLWDDSPEARGKAEAEGFATVDLTRQGALEGVALLVTSPGIPHLYPAPHKVIARAMELGVPVDNDIGLFFRSYATKDWDGFDQTPRVVAVTGSNGKSTTTALIRHILDEAGRPVQMAGNIGRGVLDLDRKALGIPELEEVVERYCAATGRTSVPDMNWYFAYNFFRLAGIMQGIKKRVIDGTASSAHAKAMSERVQPLADKA